MGRVTIRHGDTTAPSRPTRINTLHIPADWQRAPAVALYSGERRARRAQQPGQVDQGSSRGPRSGRRDSCASPTTVPANWQTEALSNWEPKLRARVMWGEKGRSCGLEQHVAGARTKLQPEQERVSTVCKARRSSSSSSKPNAIAITDAAAWHLLVWHPDRRLHALTQRAIAAN